MDELTEPHSERHSLYFGIKEEAASESFTFSEVKPGLVVIKLEPKGEIDPEPDGTVDPEPDGEIDPLALNTEDDDPVVEPEDLPCPIAFLAVESKSEDSTWDNATAAVKMEMEAQTHGDEYGVHLEELDGVGKEAWKGYVGIQTRRRRRCSSSDGLEQDRKYQEDKTEDEMERERERNRLYMRKLRASQSLEETERRREKGRMYKRLSVLRQSPEEAKRQREQNRIYMQRLRASQTPDEIERRREKGRMYKRLSVMRQTPEEAARQREQNRIYMQRLRASQTPEEVERRKAKNRMYKRLSVLRRSPEEAARQREQNRTYMRQLRAAKINNNTEMSRSRKQPVPCLISEELERQRGQNVFHTAELEAPQANETSKQDKCNRTLRRRKQRASSSDIERQEIGEGEIASHVMEMNRLLQMRGTDTDGHSALSLGSGDQTQAMEQVEREISRQIWQNSGFWEYLSLLNKTAGSK